MVDAVDPQPPVPVFRETLLLLELEAQERCLDLRRMSQLVLGDLGATVQILRLAAREYGNGNGEGRPDRIADCISDLGVNSCLETISLRTVAGDRRQSAVAEMWAHSREIAQYSRSIADEMPEVNPDQAYLVGLLHSIGLLPAVLGWKESGTGTVSRALTGFKMAEQWSFPGFVLEFFSDMHLGRCETQWPEIVRSAHQRATRSSIHCPLEQEIRPLPYRRATRTNLTSVV